MLFARPSVRLSSGQQKINDVMRSEIALEVTRRRDAPPQQLQPGTAAVG